MSSSLQVEADNRGIACQIMADYAYAVAMQYAVPEVAADVGGIAEVEAELAAGVAEGAADVVILAADGELAAGVVEGAADVALHRGVILAANGRLFQSDLPAGYQLANHPQPWLLRAKQYIVFVTGKAILVMLAKKCFRIRQSPPAVDGCRNAVTPMGDLTIGFGTNIRRAWRTVLLVLGLGENGQPLTPAFIQVATDEGTQGLRKRTGDDFERARTSPGSTPKRIRAAASVPGLLPGEDEVAARAANLDSIQDAVDREMAEDSSDSSADSLMEEEVGGPIKRQPNPYDMIAPSCPGAERYDCVCHYAMLVHSEPYWLRYIIAVWREVAENAHWAREAAAGQATSSRAP